MKMHPLELSDVMFITSHEMQLSLIVNILTVIKRNADIKFSSHDASGITFIRYAPKSKDGIAKIFQGQIYIQNTRHVYQKNLYWLLSYSLQNISFFFKFCNSYNNFRIDKNKSNRYLCIYVKQGNVYLCLNIH